MKSFLALSSLGIASRFRGASAGVNRSGPESPRRAPVRVGLVLAVLCAALFLSGCDKEKQPTPVSKSSFPDPQARRLGTEKK